jgi:S-adenosylmethionine/arginine decarboxylase-like enzyme
MPNFTLNSRFPQNNNLMSKLSQKFGSVTTSLIYLKVCLEIYLRGPDVWSKFNEKISTSIFFDFAWSSEGVSLIIEVWELHISLRTWSIDLKFSLHTYLGGPDLRCKFHL